MKNISTEFVEKLCRLSQEPLPDRVMEKARECLMDYLAVVIGGSGTYAQINHRFLLETQSAGPCRMFGSDRSADVTTAVMINAFHAHVLELDDSHRVAMTHLGAPIFSALIGAAELYHSTMEQMLRAAVVGYEAAIRIANAIQPSHKKRGFHVSGTCCTIGCAMGIAAMLQYTLPEMENVFSAAATSAAGLLGVISGRSEQKPYNIANAAVAGTNAALYGKYFPGAVDILGDSRGFLHAMSDQYDVSRLFESGYAIETIYQKLYAACRHCHAPMEAMLTLRKDPAVSAASVDHIEVQTYDLAINGHDHTEITGVSSAKQSIPYGVAAACLYGDCGMDAFTPARVSDAALLELTGKVSVHENAALTALVPKKRAAVVRVSLLDGREFSRRVDFPKGEPENPITFSEMKQKFYELTAFAGMDWQRAEQMLQLALRGEGEPVGALFG